VADRLPCGRRHLAGRYHRGVDAPSPQLTLLEAARTVARGRDLESQLGKLAEYALNMGGAVATAIYLLDPISRQLVPAAAAGSHSARPEETPVISLDDASQLAAQVVKERRAATGPDTAGPFGRVAGDVALSVVALPLIVSDEAGNEEAEGALVAAFAGAAPDVTAAEDPLSALADLCAIAIRKARLEHALIERADWIERLASTDGLTGIANRATLERMLELEIARATRQDSQLSVIMFDIDGLAQLNEAAGAHAGDDALRRFASLLADQVRLVDTIGRVGADEFGLIAPGSGGMIVARRIGEAAKKIQLANGQPLSVSAGVVVFPADGGSSTELMSAAEAALDEAKHRGRGSIAAATEVSAG
jgi:diguanylate cyclase (GGDEF)-like protein